MKRVLCLFLMLVMLISLCGCEGNFAQINLQESIEIPEDGIITESIIKQIKEENAIGSFYGESNGFTYEWTIFGSDISEVRSVNLQMTITESDDGIAIAFAEEQAFGFPALLSIHLNECWNALGATVYQNEKAVYSASLTGNQDKTIVNISVNEFLGQCMVIPDEITMQDTEGEDSTEATSATTGITDNSTEPTDRTAASSGSDNYLSAVQGSDGRVYSDGSQTGQDKYKTDPIPEGKPMPVEPEDQEVDKGQTYTCTFSIECSTILNNLDMLDPDKLECVPSNGVILKTTTVTFYAGESVYDVLQRVCKENGIQMEASWTPIYNSAYVEGIHNLYEFDCGSLSGWMYRVNGWYPNYGCSRYQLAQGDVVEWRYTCDLGNDVGENDLF